MTLKKDIEALAALGDHIKKLPHHEVAELALKARNENSWFTLENVARALTETTNYLNKSKLETWLASYSPVIIPKNIGLVLAGNIPLVGFHDILCVLLSGHNAVVKRSSKDTVLLMYLMEKLEIISPSLASRVSFVERLTEIDAIIATGSDNTARYFHHYFSKYPHIIRKNRSSVGIINGEEASKDLENLGTDIFSYFGLGCRNVSKLFVPQGYKFDFFFECIAPFFTVIDHHKYNNNYDYNKSVLLVNSEPHYDNGFLLLQEYNALVSPISVLFYEQYRSSTELDARIDSFNDKLQCIVSNGGWYPDSIAMGQAQMPELWDYADKVDTMEFLCSL